MIRLKLLAAAAAILVVTTSQVGALNFDPDEFCVGINAGIFPHPDPGQCFQYVSCLFGRGQLYSCDEGFVFDPEQFECVAGDWVECEAPGGGNPDLERLCSDVSYGVFEYEDDCARFVFCERGRPTVFQCLTREIWIQQKGVCTPGNQDTCEPGDVYCMGRPDGAIEHPEGCHLFIECINEISTVVECPRGYVFDGRGGCAVGSTESCRTSHQVCAENPAVQHPHPEFCDLFIECDGNVPRAEECGPGEIFRYDIEFCVPGDRETCVPSRPEVACEGRPDGIVPHPDECNMFIVCSGGASVSQNCPVGEILRPEIPFCVAGDSETCEFLDEVCVGRPNGWVIEHPNYCGMFIWCQNGLVQIHNCPAGEVLRPDMQWCVPGDPGSCEVFPIEEMCDGRGAVIYPHPERCDQIVSCDHGTQTVNTCPANTIVQPGTIQCVPGNPETCQLYNDLCVGRPDGSIPHPSRCHLYIDCQAGQVIVNSCPAGHIFDSTESRCVPGNVETCDNLDELCVGRPDGVISHPNRCDLFMICSGGTTSVHPCPNGEILRPDMQFCVPGNSATCQFTPVEQMCDGRPGPVVFPHPEDCSLLVRCLDGQSTIESCRDGMVVEPGRITCVAGNRDTCELYTDRCVGVSQDLIPHPSECHVFIRCNSDAISVESCPRGTIFESGTSSSCVVGDRDTCEVLQNTCETISDRILEHPNFCDLYIECRDRLTSLHTCPPSLILHPNMQVCTPGDASSCTFREVETMCQGQPVIRFPPPDQTQCLDFITCSAGQPTINTCPDGTVLRPRFIDCVPGNGQTCENFPHICLFRPNEYIPHPTRCDMFVSCISEIPHVVPCPPNHVFNPLTGTCIPGDTDSCESFDSICRNRPDGTLPHPNNCQQIVGCIDGNAMISWCPVGNIFHPTELRCVPGNGDTCTLYDDRCLDQPNGVIAFPSRCDLFIVCHSGTASAHPCPEGEILNVNIQFCAPGNAQTCEFDEPSSPEQPPELAICEDRPDGRFTHPFFCYMFIECSGGETTIGTCPPGHVFYSSTGECVPGDVDTCLPDEPPSGGGGGGDGEISDDLCVRTGIYNIPHPNSCYWYIRCVFRVAFELECPILHVFSPIFAVCVPGDRNNC